MLRQEQKNGAIVTIQILSRTYLFDRYFTPLNDPNQLDWEDSYNHHGRWEEV